MEVSVAAIRRNFILTLGYLLHKVATPGRVGSCAVQYFAEMRHLCAIMGQNRIETG
jgi:hypothetical protein